MNSSFHLPGPWERNYALWPIGALITKCRGGKNIATIGVRPIDGDYLQAGASFLYAFRIDVKSNPASTPLWNYWSMDYHGESSLLDSMRGIFRRVVCRSCCLVKVPPAWLAIRNPLKHGGNMCCSKSYAYST